MQIQTHISKICFFIIYQSHIFDMAMLISNMLKLHQFLLDKSDKNFKYKVVYTVRNITFNNSVLKSL